MRYDQPAPGGERSLPAPCMSVIFVGGGGLLNEAIGFLRYGNMNLEYF